MMSGPRDESRSMLSTEEWPCGQTAFSIFMSISVDLCFSNLNLIAVCRGNAYTCYCSKY